MNPKLILLFSGKRKSGKDFITDLLQKRIGDIDCVTIRLSAPIKYQFALDNGLNYEELLSASEYKEKCRLQMISWSEAKRGEDAGFFIRAAIDMFKGTEFPIWIVGDMRRMSDLSWFKEHYHGLLHTVLITASQEVRKQRGWNFVTGVDDAESECNLDNYTSWDQVIQNDNTDGISPHILQEFDYLYASKKR